MRWINKCLTSIEKSSIRLKTIVVDNNSTDGSVKFIKDNFSNTILIENTENLGFGKANNIGIEYAEKENADYIFLLNQDAWVEPDTIEKLISVHKNNLKLGIISPLHYNGIGKELDKNFQNCLTQDNKTDYLNSNIVWVPFVNAAAWLLPISTIKKIGCFNSIFEHYGEDRDYCNRVHYHSLGIVVYTKAKIFHDRNYSTSNVFRKERNKLLSIGLALLTDINNSLIKNYTILYTIRVRKIIKNILFLNFTSVINEVYTLFHLTVKFSAIKKSRDTLK